MGKFKPGQSGNPGGRTKAHRELGRYIREQTKDGKELADICLKIARDDEEESRVRMLAIEWLGDRGIGKSVQPVELAGDVTVSQPLDMAALTDEQLRALSVLDAELGDDDEDGATQH